MRARIRSIIRAFVFRALWLSGVTRWLSRKLRDENVVIVLMLHRVLSEVAKGQTNSEKTIIVGDRAYAGMIAHIRKYYRWIDVGAEQIEFAGDRLGIGLTFDDGWADNFTPLMTERVPATVFVSPSLTGKKRPFWPEEVREILRDAGEGELKRAVEELKPLAPERRQERIRALARSKGTAEGNCGAADETMSWEQLDTLRAAGIRLGSHTMDHEILTSLKDISQIDAQVAESQRQLANRWGSCDLLAYPNGDHNNQVVERARVAGYRRAFTVLPGCWGAETDPLRIPRMNITDSRVTLSGEFSPAAFEYAVIVRAYRCWRAAKASKVAGTRRTAHPAHVSPAGD